MEIYVFLTEFIIPERPSKIAFSLSLLIEVGLQTARPMLLFIFWRFGYAFFLPFPTPSPFPTPPLTPPPLAPPLLPPFVAVVARPFPFPL